MVTSWQSKLNTVDESSMATSHQVWIAHFQLYQSLITKQTLMLVL